MKFKTFKLLYTYLASAVYLIPIFYLFKDMFNHKDLRIDFIFIFTVLIFRATLYAEFAIKMILEIISQPHKLPACRAKPMFKH